MSGITEQMILFSCDGRSLGPERSATVVERCPLLRGFPADRENLSYTLDISFSGLQVIASWSEGQGLPEGLRDPTEILSIVKVAKMLGMMDLVEELIQKLVAGTPARTAAVRMYYGHRNDLTRRERRDLSRARR
jgi:hypothetical protein